MLSPEAIAGAAARLHQAERSRQQINALTQEMDISLDDAYAIQDAWMALRLAEGEEVIGYKIGLTSRAMQLAMNIDTPDSGVLTDAMRFESGVVLDVADFLDPRIEAEFAFVLGHPILGPKVSEADVLAATEYVQPALELISARSRRTDPETGYTRTVCDTIADNAANAGIILGGAAVPPAEIDLAWAGAVVRVDGAVEDTGLGAAVMGHPARAVAWLAERLLARGQALEAGHVVLSGSFTRPIEAIPGRDFAVDYGVLGTVEVTFR